MLEELFKFPVVLVDGENEERKIRDSERFGDLPKQPSLDYDLVFGEAEYPHWDLIGIEDRWLPTRESFSKAMNGQFEACIVRFANVGQLLVPWTKKKFKTALLKFADEYKRSQPEKPKRVIKIKTISPEDYDNIVGHD